MGWWTSNDDADVTIGDTVLDLTRRFLNEFSQEYQEDLNRKPNLEELKYALTLVFKVNVDDTILQNFEELEIKSVEIKTGKRPKRLKPVPGDIFAFKIKDECFGFGRLISKVSVGMVAEIFDYISPHPIFDMTKTDSWLIQPLVLDTYSLFERRLEGDWRIIAHTEPFVADSKYDNIKFIYGEPPNNLKAVSVDDKTQPISSDAARGCREYAPYGDYHVIQFVEAEL